MDMNSFLVRESVQDGGNLFLSVKNGDKCYHFPIIDRDGLGFIYEIHGTHLTFSSLPELVDHYRQNGLPERIDGKLIQLIRPCSFPGVPQSQSARPQRQQWHDYNTIDDVTDGTVGNGDHDTR